MMKRRSQRKKIDDFLDDEFFIVIFYNRNYLNFIRYNQRLKSKKREENKLSNYEQDVKHKNKPNNI